MYETLESFGGLELSKPTRTSVLARLVGDGGLGRTIALRADMDALPITEETGFKPRPKALDVCVQFQWQKT